MTTLVLIPGIMSDERTWSRLAEAISGGAVIHVADTTQDSTIEAMAARVISAAERDLVVAAHSMGTRVAMEIGRQAPQRAKAMILAGAGHKSAAEDERPKREQRIASAYADMPRYADEWVPTVLSPVNRGNEQLVERIRQMVLDCPPEVHERQNRALLSRPDASTDLGGFDFPVLLITGAEDTYSPEAHQLAIAALLPRAESRVIENAGHLLTFEQPERTTEIILEWLSRQGLAVSGSL